MASLSRVPRGKELEDFVAALLNCNGYFVEKNIAERVPQEILELDIVATNYAAGAPRRALFEIKSGKWGFSDIFKLLGWKCYLGSENIDKAYFVATRLRDDEMLTAMQDRFRPHGIDIIAVPDHTAVEEALREKGILQQPPGVKVNRTGFHRESVVWVTRGLVGV